MTDDETIALVLVCGLLVGAGLMGCLLLALGGMAMTEEELLAGVMDAALVGGWMLHHDRRSDLALQQGMAGFPDVVAIHPERAELLVLELKAEGGRLTPLQQAWLDAWQAVGVDARVVRAADYDDLWRHLVGDRLRRATRA